MPPVFAPGVWAGVNDSLLINRQREQEQMRLAGERQKQQRDAWTLQAEQEDRQRQLGARRAAGQTLYGLAPPPVGGGQPQGPAPQPPMPGTPSAPPQRPQQPPMQGGPQGGPPAMPQGAPQGGAPMQPPGMRPQQMQQPDPRVLEIQRCQTDLQALDREMSRPGLTPEQKAILTSEKSKTQDRLSQLTGQPPPYRSVPTGEDQQQVPGMPPQSSPMAPPPVGGGQQAPHTTLLQQVIEGARKNGVPPDQLMDVVDTLSPVLKNQLQEELASLKGTQASQMMEIRALTLGLREQELARLAKKDERTGDQRDRALDQNAERIAMAKKKAESGAAPTASELQDPETARIFYDIYKVSGKTPPFAWGKAGEADRTAWMQAVKRFAKEDGVDGGGIAGGQADAKAAGGALNQTTKDLAAIRPYKVMLDKNADIAISLGKKLQVSDSTLANRPIQWLQKNGGSDPDLREYLAQIQIVQTEAARVLNNPRLVGQLTDSARHEMQEIIKGTMPLADTERVLQRMKQDGTNRVEAIEKEAQGLRARTSGKAGKADAGDDQDAQAIAWAKANPGDPRAKKIMALHQGS